MARAVVRSFHVHNLKSGTDAQVIIAVGKFDDDRSVVGIRGSGGASGINIDIAQRLALLIDKTPYESGFADGDSDRLWRGILDAVHGPGSAQSNSVPASA